MNLQKRIGLVCAFSVMNLTRVYLAFSCRIAYSAVTTILSRDICRGPSGFCLLVASLITSKRHPGRDANAILAANTKHYPLLFATVHCTCTLDERVTLVGKRTPHQNEVNPTSNRSPAINLNIKRLQPILDYPAYGSGADPGSWQSACR